MIGLLQRVSQACVQIDGQTTARIGRGLLVLVGVQRGDIDQDAIRLAERLLGYRVFADEHGRMNRSLVDESASLLLVPQFTLAANTRKGSRASFTSAADPHDAVLLFDALVTTCRASGAVVAVGSFGAHMQVSLVNDGPVTFWLES